MLSAVALILAGVAVSRRNTEGKGKDEEMKYEKDKKQIIGEEVCTLCTPLYL